MAKTLASMFSSTKPFYAENILRKIVSYEIQYSVAFGHSWGKLNGIWEHGIVNR